MQLGVVFIPAAGNLTTEYPAKFKEIIND